MQNVDREGAQVRSSLDKLYYNATASSSSARDAGTDTLQSDLRTRAGDPPPQGLSVKSFLVGLAVSSVCAGLMCGGPTLLFAATTQVQEVASKIIPPTPAYLYGSEKERAVTVMQGIPGMKAEKSVITGIVDPVSLSAVYYWTFALKNDTGQQQEAQFEIALPKGAAVSRATLWINGVPQEAAFSSTQQVTAAYQWITQRHRDPLLVTQVGENRILVKASPVQPGGQPMQLRLGITAPMGVDSSGQAKVMLPHIVASNTAFDARQDVHIEAPVALYSSEPSARTTAGDHGGSVLRANTSEKSLNDLSITASRPWSPSRFATRATHSSPPAFIVADLQYDYQTGLRLPKFRKSVARPNVYTIADENAAHRLSTLWAANEINRLSSSGNTNQAVDLANAYRVVSPVSGATVLEMESDYSYNALNRNMNRSLSYVPGNEVNTTNSFRADAFSTGSQTSTVTMTAPILQGATNGTIGPQAGDATVITGVNTAGTVRVNNSAALESYTQFTGAAGNYLFASARDANLFDGARDASLDGGGGDASAWFAVLVIVALTAWTFAGPLTLFIESLGAMRRRDASAFKTGLLSVAWLAVALLVPSVSQIMFALMAAQLLWSHRNNLRTAMTQPIGRRAG